MDDATDINKNCEGLKINIEQSDLEWTFQAGCIALQLRSEYILNILMGVIRPNESA